MDLFSNPPGTAGWDIPIESNFEPFIIISFQVQIVKTKPQ